MIDLTLQDKKNHMNKIKADNFRYSMKLEGIDVVSPPLFQEKDAKIRKALILAKYRSSELVL
ncbi:MAG: hypothetical protein JEZ12_21105 [Desulfobacterium sp.]|nr:hypothetical protein [Desulfobacterium sp.]